MPTTARTIRLFVSSTFSDMKAERNVLQRDVFPKLQRHCLANGLRFQAIDLRWGVSEEAGRDNRTMRICLRELKRCQEPGRPRPNFLILLGNRYGWRPLPELVPADLFEALEKKLFPSEAERLREWYRRDDNAVPPVYELQPRGEEVTGWHETVEKRLLGFLEKAKEALRSDPVLTGELRGTLDAAAIGISATEQEIRAGALTVEDARHHVHAFYRTITGPPPDQLPGDYVDLADGHPDSLAAEALRNLKDRIKETIGENVRPYDVPWRGNDVSEADLSQFTSDVYDRLKAVIDVQIGSLKEIPPEEQEEDAHRTFGEERRAGFIGRDEPLKLIADYLHDGPAQILAAVGPAGSGKSAVMAEAVHRARLMTNDDGIVLARFLGVTLGSSDLIQTLRDVVGRIRERYPREGAGERPASGGERPDSSETKPDDREIPTDINPLTSAFHEGLARVTPDRPLWLFLDALDQLRDTELAATLSWLPDKLPAGVRIIVSSALPAGGKTETEGPSPETSPADPREPILRNLGRLAPGAQTILLNPLTVEDGAALLEQWLATAGRKLQQAQREPILRSFVVEGNALWLRVAAEEATRQASWSAPESLPFSLPALLETVLMRLSRNEEHGEILVKRALGYLASARHGLAEDEVVGILGIDPVVMEDVIARAPTERAKPPEERIKTLPLAVWVRLHGDIAYYLTERQNQGSALLGFYHRTFGEAVECFCLADASSRLAIHDTKAQWFGGQSWFLPPVSEEKTTEAKPDRDNPPNTRKASELPWHLQRVAGLAEPQDRWDALVDILCDLDCVEVKARSGLIYELINDYNAALAALPEFAEENEGNRLRDTALFRYNKALREYAVARYQWFQAKKRGQTRPEPPYPLLPPELQHEAERQIPEEASTRAARLRHFTNFVNNNEESLGARPRDTLCIARNYGEVNPVSEAAEEKIVSRKAPWLKFALSPCTYPVRPQCIRTLKEHQKVISCIGVSPNGRSIVSGSWDMTLRIWDLKTGACLRTLEGHTRGIISVCLAPDGTHVASGSEDYTVRIWDLQTGHCIKALSGFNSSIPAVSFSPDSKSLIAGDSLGRVTVWNMEDGVCTHLLERHIGSVKSLAMSPDGRRIISASEGVIYIWDIELAACTHTIEGQKNLTVCISPDGMRAISSDEEMNLRIWDMESGLQLDRFFRPKMGKIVAACITPDGRRVVTGGDDETVRIWDLGDGSCCGVFRGHTRTVYAVSITPDGRNAVSATHDKTIRVWDLDSNIPTKETRKTPIESMAASPDGKYLICGNYNGSVQIFDTKSGVCSWTLKGHRAPVLAISVNSDSRFAVSGGADKTVRIWDLAAVRCLRVFEGHGDVVEYVRMSAHGGYVVSIDKSGVIREWQVATGICTNTVRCKCHFGYEDKGASLSVDGRRVIFGNWTICDAKTGECLRVLDGYGIRGYGYRNKMMCESPDGQLMIVVDGDKMKIWDVRNGIYLHTLVGHRSRINCISIFRNGRNIISGSEDETIRIWDIETGSCVFVAELQSEVDSVAIISEADRIACGTWDGQIHFLDAINFPPVGPVILTALNAKSVHCPCCATEFEPPADVLAVILPASKFPYLSQAFADPRLLTTCPRCAKPLKFNPFLAASS